MDRESLTEARHDRTLSQDLVYSSRCSKIGGTPEAVIKHLLSRPGWLALPLFLVSAGAASAVTFSYSITCSSLNVGPDQIQAYTQAGSVNLVPNVASTSNTIDFFNASTTIFFNAGNASFNSTLACNFTLGGVTANASRPFTLVITDTGLVGSALESSTRPKGIATGHETHTFTFQAFSFNVVIPGQGTVTVSQGPRIVTGTINLIPPSAGIAAAISTVVTADPSSSTLLFVPLPPVPLPPTIFFTLTGLGAAGWYEIRRRTMAALRR